MCVLFQESNNSAWPRLTCLLCWCCGGFMLCDISHFFEQMTWYSLWGSICHTEDKNSFSNLISSVCLGGCWTLVITLLVAGISSAQASPSLLWTWINPPPVMLRSFEYRIWKTSEVMESYISLKSHCWHLRTQFMCLMGKSPAYFTCVAAIPVCHGCS